MSHVVQIQTEVRDPNAIRAACHRRALPAPVFGLTQLYSSRAVGWAVRLPDWRYPVVCDVSKGQLSFDNFDGRWGDPRELDRFLQAYAIEAARLQARRNGHTVTEQPLDDGSIQLTIEVGEQP